MAAYGGVSINVEVDSRLGYRPHWEREVHHERRHITGANRDDVQFSGLGNERVTLHLLITSDAVMAQLRAWEGDGIARTLTDPFGDSVNYTGTYLMKLSTIQRQSFAQNWECDALFERIAS